MIGLFGSSSRYVIKVFCSNFNFRCCNNSLCISLTHRLKVMHSPAYVVNYFNTCRWFFKENIENIENFNSSKMIIKKDGTVKKKKKPVGVKVYLLNEKGISSSMYLQDAEKLAQRQDLHLKKVEDINGIAAYKLVPISDLLETEIQTINNKEKKKEKIKKLVISADIKPHDLQIKINHISKFLEKGMKVFVKLGDRSNESSKLEPIYCEIQKSFDTYSINKQVSKSGYIINISPKQKNTELLKKQIADNELIESVRK